MPGGLTGFAAGFRTATQDVQQRQLAQLGMQEGQGKLEAQRIANQQAQLSLDQQRKLLSMMNSIGTHGGQMDPSQAADSMASQMQTLGNMAYQSGLPEQAKEYYKTASTIKKNQAEIDKSQQQILMRNADLVSRLMVNVHDQQSFDQAQALFTAVTGHPSRYSGARYTPELKQQIESTAQSIKDRAIQKKDEAQAREADARATESKARIPLIKAQEREDNARTAALEKTGAVTKPPTAGETRVVTDLIEREFPSGGDPDQQANLRTLSRPIAERMKELQKSHPNMSQSQAAKRAFDEAKARGDFGGLTPAKAAAGDSYSSPLDIPIKDGKIDPKNVKPNKFYKGIGKYSSQIFTWDPKSKQLKIANAPDEIDVDEDEGDEDDTAGAE